MTYIYPETLEMLKLMVSHPNPSDRIPVKGYSLKELTSPFSECTELEAELAKLLEHALHLLCTPWRGVAEYEKEHSDELLEAGTYEVVFRYEDGREELVARTYQSTFTTKVFGAGAHRFRLTTAMKDFKPEMELKVGKYQASNRAALEIFCIQEGHVFYKHPSGDIESATVPECQDLIRTLELSFVEEVAE